MNSRVQSFELFNGSSERSNRCFQYLLLDYTMVCCVLSSESIFVVAFFSLKSKLSVRGQGAAAANPFVANPFVG